MVKIGGGNRILKFSVNLCLILVCCVVRGAIVVCEMIDRLWGKIGAGTSVGIGSGVGRCVGCGNG